MDILLVASPAALLRVDPGDGHVTTLDGLAGHHPSAVASDSWVEGRVWCATSRGFVFRSDDAGATWSPSGLASERLTAIVASPARKDLAWAGTEPSAVWRSDDAGTSWRRCADLDELPSSSEWSFPPRPDTHHVRWIACHPTMPDRLWVAVEAG
ncbi:MAG: WD40/YVTN/BNR-like repeat-containing protein, partial [Longimicrobiales bacterium]